MDTRPVTADRKTPRLETDQRDTTRRAVGAYGERMAARHLEGLGLRIVDRNWRCARGEIDLVAVDGDCLVVVEVKTRRTIDFGTPVEQVSWRKLARLRRLAAMWLAEHPGRFTDVRVDVIGVWRPPSGRCQVEHLPGVC
jgi:putative endonuclease